MENLITLDKKYIWHPFTQQSEWINDFPSEPLIISRAKGVYLYDSKGERYLDGVSSLWANLHGHRNSMLDRAVRKQLNKVAHTTFLGLTHEPAIQLARELVKFLPQGLTRIFYSDNGSTAVEVALKMAFQYQQNYALQTANGKNPKSKISKTEFLALKNSYHGDTIGSVSLGGIELFHKKFRPLLFRTHFAMSPHCLRCPYKRVHCPQSLVHSYSYSGENPNPGDFRKETGCRWECLGEVETLLRKNKKIVAAIVEPLLQGAGGMIVMPPGYLRGFERLCRKYGVLFIADEVATGFGRTGKMFAVEQEGVHPDLLCMAKGISGGYLPLAATAVTEKIYRGFLGKIDEFKTFYHGHTYTANPLACAVSCASIKLFERENLLQKVQRKSLLLKKLLEDLISIPVVGEVRQIGLVAGIEIVADKNKLLPFPLWFQAAKRICAACRKKGILLRPLGDVIVLMPPLVISEKELRFLVAGLKETLIQFSKQTVFGKSRLKG